MEEQKEEGREWGPGRREEGERRDRDRDKGRDRGMPEDQRGREEEGEASQLAAYSPPSGSSGAGGTPEDPTPSHDFQTPTKTVLSPCLCLLQPGTQEPTPWTTFPILRDQGSDLELESCRDRALSSEDISGLGIGLGPHSEGHARNSHRV